MRRLPLVFAAVASALVGARAGAEPITALTSVGTLVTFDSATPGTLIGGAVTITGLTAGDTLVGMDTRPLDFALIGLGFNSATGTARIYSLNRTTGAATQINAAALTLGTGPNGFGVDFNPVPNALRIVTNSTSNNNQRVTAGGTGTINIDTDVNPGAPDIRGVAYSNNFAGASTTTLFGISVNAPTAGLVTQGSPGGSPTSPNTGTVFLVAPLSGVTPNAVTGFDISGTTGTAYLSSGTQLFTLNLTTGAATTVGTIGTGLTILDITAVPEPGSLALAGVGLAALVGFARRRRARSPV